jgi:branched-chain amino acid transport system ATP-binding protein
VALLEVRNLEVTYKKIITAVRDVSIDVEDGEIAAIVGLNGAGKTTTLRAITGFMPAEDVAIRNGSISFAGRDVTGWRPDRIAAAGVAAVPERRKVFETLKVEENILAAMRGGGDGVSEDDIYDLFPPIAARRQERAIFLSGGEQQMLAIAMGLLARPRLLVVDEASLGLAPRLVVAIIESLVRINRELGMAILLVDQNAEAVLSIATHGYVMEGGRVVMVGSGDRLLRHGDIREFYLGIQGDRARGYRDVKQYRRSRRWWG